jgi:peptidase E
VIAWSAGAMVMSPQIVLFHDSPPQGQSDPEVYDDGLALAPNVVVLPHGSARLNLDDRQRVEIFARRFSPSTCVILDEGCGLHWDGDEWTPLGDVRFLGEGGKVMQEVGR